MKKNDPQLGMLLNSSFVPYVLTTILGCNETKSTNKLIYPFFCASKTRKETIFIKWM